MNLSRGIKFTNDQRTTALLTSSLLAHSANVRLDELTGVWHFAAGWLQGPAVGWMLQRKLDAARK